MASCEKCWAIAVSRCISNPSKSKTDHYYDVMAEAQSSGKCCTPKEKAGQFWDEEKQCDSRVLKGERIMAKYVIIEEINKYDGGPERVAYALMDDGTKGDWLVRTFKDAEDCEKKLRRYLENMKKPAKVVKELEI